MTMETSLLLKRVRLWAFALFMLPIAGAAHAGPKDALKNAWQCTKATINVQVALGKTLVQKSEKVADLGTSAGVCLAEASADPEGFAVIAGVITAVKVASPGSLPNGQCYAKISGDLARPVAMALSAVLPSGTVKNQLIEKANSPELAQSLWKQISDLPPPVSTLASHVQCTCIILDDGLDLLDISEVTDAIADVSSSCAGLLDSVGLGFINTYGGKAIRWSKDQYTAISGDWDNLMGQSNPAPDEVVYQRFYGTMVGNMAQVIATKGGAVGTLKVDAPSYSSNYKGGGAGCYQNYDACRVNMAQMLDNCVAYYDSHTLSPSSALEVCNRWQARFPGEVARLVKEHKGYTAFLVVAQSVKTRMFNDYGWRLPRHVSIPLNGPADPTQTTPWTKAQVETAFVGIAGYPTIPDPVLEPWTFTGTGVYAAAPRLLPLVAYNGPKTYELAYAALRPQIRAAILKEWAKAQYDVRLKYLPKVFPTKEAFAGPYGCPSSGPLVGQCSKYIENTFDNHCRTPLATLWADASDGGSALTAETGAVQACRAQLTPLVTSANDLSGDMAELQSYQQRCQVGAGRNEAQTQCLKDWSDLWDTCRSQAYKPPYSSAKTTALACLSKGTFKVVKIDTPQGDTGSGGRPSTPIRPATSSAAAPVRSAPAGSVAHPNAPMAPKAGSVKPSAAPPL